MTNKFLLLAVAGTLALASCQSDVRTTGTDEEMQAKIDSAVQARMQEMQAQLAAQNDSLINAVAMMRADSMMASAAAAGRNNTGVRRTVPTTRPGTAPTVNNTPRSNTPRNVNDRPGGNGGTDNKGNTSDNAPKNVNDRPGGN